MPVNPDDCKDCYEDFNKYKKLIEEDTNIRVINLTDLLMDSEYFYDYLHPNREGAKIISAEIAKQLNQ